MLVFFHHSAVSGRPQGVYKRGGWRCGGFGAVDAVFLIACVMLLVAVLLPILTSARMHSRTSQNNIQLRGIHQGLLVCAQTSAAGGADGFFLDFPSAAISTPPTTPMP